VFDVLDNALFDVIFGKFNPVGKLPFELPSSMEAVRNQLEDVPFDSKDPLFEFGYGLSYGQTQKVSTVQPAKTIPVQQATLNGKITDAFTGNPLGAVTIEVKGTKTKLVSQNDGSFSLVLPKGAKSLVFSIIGYETLEVAVAGDTMTVEMSAIQIDPSLW
jgi:hypothetical protein